MKCKQTEKFILRSFDDRLNSAEKAELKSHLDNCPECRKRKKEYQILLQTLGSDPLPEMKPYFWERVQPKLKEKKGIDPWTVWRQFGLRAIPLSLLFVIVFVAAVLVFIPAQTEELNLSQTGVFLLENSNPLEETKAYLSEEGEVNKHIMLLFSSLDESENVRRYFP
ncbi:MAG: zf-HC2 domain-containing protein [Candidatus Aminicenantes bacterium]|jgi:hypothetical protein